MVGFPFDSQVSFDETTGEPTYDRAISSQPLRKLIRDLFTTGVMPNPSTNFQVSAGTDGMTVQVQAGYAVVDGGLCQETEVRTLEVTASDTTYDRIDTVVLRWNENVDVRRPDLYIIAGTPSANPVRPTLQRDNSIYEIGLADVFITKRVATITNDKITDTRYESERCGIVSSVSQWDTTTIYNQVQADLAEFKSGEESDFETWSTQQMTAFTAWFETIQDILDENVAAHLQNEIDELDGKIDNVEDTIGGLQAEISDIENIYGAKNIFPYDPNINNYPYTGYGVTISRNEETGMFTINGTSTSGRIVYLTSRSGNWNINDYVGMKLNVVGTLLDKFYCSIRYYNSSTATNYEKNVSITNTDDYIIEDYPYILISLGFVTDVTFSNDTLSVMLRSANVTDRTYQPITKTNKELTQAINQLNSDLSDKVDHFSSGNYAPVTGISYDSTNKKLGLKVNGADTVIPFSSGAKLVGTYSNDTTINVSSYGASSASQFLAVSTSSKSISGYGSSNSWSSDLQELYLSGSYTPPSLSMNGNVLSITPATISASSYLTELNNWQKPVRVSTSNSTTLPTKLYYVGDIET